MRISTYHQLKAAVVDLLTKSTAAASLDRDIQMAESRMNRLLRSREMETRAAAILSCGIAHVPVPADFGGVRYFKVTSVQPPHLVRPQSPQQIGTHQQSAPGLPQFFAIVADNFQLSPTPAIDYTAEISYYKKVPPLTEDMPSNWVLSNHPDCYLFGAAFYASQKQQDWERAANFEKFFIQAFAEIESADAHDRWSGGPLRITTDWATR